MKFWNWSLFVSLLSFTISVILFFLPRSHTAFSYNRDGAPGAGTLFPFMLLIWILSLVAFAMNNVFADKCYIDKNIEMHPFIKYLPSLIGIPSFCSFAWFLYSLVKSFSPSV